MNKRKKACQCKSYLSKEAAYTVARKTWHENHFRVYKCPYCSGWHFSRHKGARMEYLFALIEEQRKDQRKGGLTSPPPEQA